MMIRSIIFIRVLFADLLFRFRDRDIFDERRRLVRGGERGSILLRASHYDQECGSQDRGHVTPGGGGVTLSSEHRVV